jgi:hypothetical protein
MSFMFSPAALLPIGPDRAVDVSCDISPALASLGGSSLGGSSLAGSSLAGLSLVGSGRAAARLSGID